MVRLLHVLICIGKECYAFGAVYLNDLTANILCLIFIISSIGLVLFDCIFSHVGFLMVMSSCRYFGADLLDAFECEQSYFVGNSLLYGQPVQVHLSASVELEYFGLPSTILAQMFCITWYLLIVLFGRP